MTPDHGARVRTITVQSPTSRGLLGAGAGVVLAMVGVLVYCTQTNCLGN